MSVNRVLNYLLEIKPLLSLALEPLPRTEDLGHVR